MKTQKQAVWEAIRDLKKCTTEDVAAVIGIPQKGVSSLCHLLLQSGLVYRVKEAPEAGDKKVCYHYSVSVPVFQHIPMHAVPPAPKPVVEVPAPKPVLVLKPQPAAPANDEVAEFKAWMEFKRLKAAGLL